MVIRQQQHESLSNYMRQQFEERMEAHLRTRFPEETESLDEPDLRQMISWGVDQAAKYGVGLENDVTRYLEYMIVLCRDFDTNPETSWAAEVLRAKEPSGSEKMRRIDNIYLFSRRDKYERPSQAPAE